jgi:hypothetical protein
MQNCEVLYIIGNGFDIRHNIPSSYYNFAAWVMKNHPIEGISLDLMFNKGNNLWSNFEEALGNYDPNKAIDGFFTPMVAECTEDNLSDVSFHTIRALSYDEIVSLFCHWIESIDLSEIHPTLRLNPKSCFLTFNYTKTLELVYNINPQHILHIHGIVDNPDSIIFGHNNYIDIESILGNTQCSREWINQSNRLFEMNLLYKDTESIIKKNPSIANLIGFQTITILGHSLNKVDRLYFEQILLQNPTAVWIIDYNPKKPMELESKTEFLKELGVKKVLPFA